MEKNFVKRIRTALYIIVKYTVIFLLIGVILWDIERCENKNFNFKNSFNYRHQIQQNYIFSLKNLIFKFQVPALLNDLQFLLLHSKKSRVASTRSVVGFVCWKLRVDSINTQACRINTHLWHTNPTALRVESTRDFLLCKYCIFSKKYCKFYIL
jgi:hypothetical protein